MLTIAYSIDGGGVKRKLNVGSPTLDNLEFWEFNPPEKSRAFNYIHLLMLDLA